MSNMLQSKALAWAVGLSVFFAILTAVVPKVLLLTLMNGVFLGIVTAVFIVYSPMIWYSLRKNKTDRASQLAFGIGLLWLSIAGQRLYWIVWQAHGGPLSWQSNYFLSAMAFLAIIGGGLFVTAPGYPAPDRAIPVSLWGANRPLLMTLGAIGGFVAFALSVYFE